MANYYSSPTVWSTSPIDYTRGVAEELPDSKALRDMIEKFKDYRNKLAEEKDKKEFDDFLSTILKSS